MSSNVEIVSFKSMPIYLCNSVTDMRLGFPGLKAKVEKEAKKDPQKGLYIFVNRDFRRVKLFYWDKDGYAMWYKTTSRSTFVIARKYGYSTVTAVNLKALLGGRSGLKLVKRAA